MRQKVFTAGSLPCGLYCLSTSHYDPATRQFVSAVPAKADGEESAYQYCAGNPIANHDPSGQFSLRSAWRGLDNWAERHQARRAVKSSFEIATPYTPPERSVGVR